MPVKSVKRGKVFRVVESGSGKIAKNKAGTSVDGGGTSSKLKAQGQARAINRSQARRK